MNYYFQIIVLVALTSRCTFAYQVEVVPSPKSDLGEGAHWDAETQNLYYVDIIKPSLLRFDYMENKVYEASIANESKISCIIPVAGEVNQFAVCIGRRVGVYNWDGKSLKATLLRIAFDVEQSPEYRTNNFNDAKADPYGRFYGGTERIQECADEPQAVNASLYRYTPCDGVVRLRRNVYISNGLAWNKMQNKLYYIDSCQLDVKEYDYDPKTGDICNERVVIDFRVNGQYPGFIPDGMTIDVVGNLYVAAFKGSKIIKIDPRTGEILSQIKIPAKQVTSAAFGGPNLDILYVTTAAKRIDIRIGAPDYEAYPPLSGSLFKITELKSNGFPGVKLKLRCQNKWVSYC